MRRKDLTSRTAERLMQVAPLTPEQAAACALTAREVLADQLEQYGAALTRACSSSKHAPGPDGAPCAACAPVIRGVANSVRILLPN